MNAERKMRWWEKNLGSHKKELQQRTENNKKKRLKLTESEIIEQREQQKEKRKENQGKTSRLCGQDRQFREPR